MPLLAEGPNQTTIHFVSKQNNQFLQGLIKH